MCKICIFGGFFFSEPKRVIWKNVYQLPFFHKAVAFLSVEKLEAQGLSGTNCIPCACSPTSLDKGCDICGDFIDSRTFCFVFEKERCFTT